MKSPRARIPTLLHPSSVLPSACRSVWRAAALSSHAPHSHQGENRGEADTKNMSSPVEDPQHIKKDISINSNENHNNGTDTNEKDDEGLEAVNEGASTLLKDQSGPQEQTSS